MNTVLLIEDVEMIRTTVKLILGRAGFEVLLAPSVVEAQRLWTAHQARIDLVITDNSLPDGSGIEVVKKFEQEKPSIKVIVTSGLPHEALPPHYFQLSKPFDAKILLAFVRGALDRPNPA